MDEKNLNEEAQILNLINRVEEYKEKLILALVLIRCGMSFLNALEVVFSVNRISGGCIMLNTQASFSQDIPTTNPKEYMNN